MPISIEERGEQSKICMPPYRLSERTGWTTMRISAKDLKMQSYSKANVSGNAVLFQGKRMYSIERQAATQAFGETRLFHRDARLFIGKWVPSSRPTRRLTSPRRRLS